MKLFNKCLIVISAILTIFVCTDCATKGIKGEQELPLVTEKSVTPLVGSYEVNRYLFKNGLRLLVIEDHSSPTFAYQTWFRVGSRDEKKGYTGLAHLFEHMMFKETKNLKDGEFDKILESEGVEGENAFTSRDYTAYIQELPSEKLDLIARLEAERMVNLVINEQAFKTEREVVQNERRYRNENNPDGLMYQEIFGLAFTTHSYHWPVIGYQEDLDRMTAKDALDFYKAHYNPNNAVIIVTGDVVPANVARTVAKYYGALEPQPATPTKVEPEPLQKNVRRQQLKLKIQVEKLLMGYHVPEVSHDDIPAINVLQMVLTGGKSSRLYRALVSTGIASSVESYGMEDRDPSLFVISANMQKNKKATEAESVILRTFERLSKETVPQQELERAKNRVNFNFFENLDGNNERAYFIGHYESIANGFELGLEQQKRIQSVSAADLQFIIKRYFDQTQRVVITGVKGEEEKNK
ncbi:MAG: pitrilysin family protein [Bdellovibrionota bacterium]